MFHNCSCVEAQGHGLGNSSAVLGQCQRESCTKAFPYFLALQTACAFILALGGTPTYMIMFRWNTLPYLDRKAWGKRNRIWYLLFHSYCEEWFADEIGGLSLCLYSGIHLSSKARDMPVHHLNSSLRLSGYIGVGMGGPYPDPEHRFSLLVTGVFLTEQWTWDKRWCYAISKVSMQFTLPRREAFTFVKMLSGKALCVLCVVFVCCECVVCWSLRLPLFVKTV